MANDKLENLAKIGQLKAEPATEEEIAGLQKAGAIRLADAKNEALSKESRFSVYAADLGP
ncbi:MAG: hypothetical protein WBM88_11505 [Woeseiaceae bacterium]